MDAGCVLGVAATIAAVTPVPQPSRDSIRAEAWFRAATFSGEQPGTTIQGHNKPGTTVSLAYFFPGPSPAKTA